MRDDRAAGETRAMLRTIGDVDFGATGYVQDAARHVRNSFGKDAGAYRRDESFVAVTPALFNNAVDLEKLLTEIETLVRRINHTNSQTPFEGATLTDALARRDATLRARRLYSQVAVAATARQDRYSRSEVRYVPTVDVAQLRKMADDAAKAYRELDTKIQQVNWSTQLL